MAKKKYVQLPHGYLSYSQMSLWLSNQEKYKQKYFDKRPDFIHSNSGQMYGKKVATALENAEDTGDLLTDSAMLLIPKYDVADQAIEVEVKTKHGWVKLIAKPDTLDSVTKNFREYKTGKHPWTKRKAQDHLQMIFYAVVIWQKYGIQLPNAYLDWIETADTENGIQPTGVIESFEVTFTPVQYIQLLAQMIQVALDIELAWASHESKPWITTF